MDTANEMLRSVNRHLEQYGIELTCEKPDAAAEPDTWNGTLRFGDRTTHVRVLRIAPMTLTALAKAERGAPGTPDARIPTLLIGRLVHERSAATFREMGILFVDTTGNAYIRFEAVLIDVRGRRLPPRGAASAGGPADPSTTRSANLFSTGRAQVIAALLTWPDLAVGTVRNLARAAGVSTGQAHGALTLLEQFGYLVDGVIRSDRFDELIDLWASAYRQGLGQKLALASYHSPGRDDGNGGISLHQMWGNGSEELELSGESVPGLGLRHPLSLTIYADDWSSRQAVRHGWRAATSSLDANVHVRRRFWRHPPQAEIGTDELSIAPWPIVFADLMATADPRLAAAANDWRSHHRPT